jgi:hypothetical protein
MTTHTEALATITRELYMPYPKSGQSYVINQQYVGHQGRQRMQVRTLQVHDDVYQDAAVRYSDDNASTWSQFQPDAERDIQMSSGHARARFLFSGCYDPAADRLIRTCLMRTHKGDPRVDGLSAYWDHSLCQTSADNGKTWDYPQLIAYEEGAEYSHQDFGNAEYLEHNQSYAGYNVIALRDGGVATACSVATEITNAEGESESVRGVMLFLGQWNEGEQKYIWTNSNPVTVTRSVSDRGLLEPWVAQLRNGDLFIDMRGNATKANPGRNFRAVSTDGGHTVSEARELHFDDGTRFYAPSSLSMMHRHANGRLYWFGNISEQPTAGNSPRYPLVLAEVDETQPALIRQSLTVIDDHDPETQTAAVQFSNFSLLEDRDTHAFEILMTVWGEFADVYQANVYRYVVTLHQ